MAGEVIEVPSHCPANFKWGEDNHRLLTVEPQAAECALSPIRDSMAAVAVYDTLGGFPPHVLRKLWKTVVQQWKDGEKSLIDLEHIDWLASFKGEALVYTASAQSRVM